ncbi:papain-like cysteine protease family protein [Cyanobium gracile UHCC 0139]|uniref:Papain-like cysteine protease family protein n=1 Tax=Cyanobium gracile UHCC 0139 TaxID=3110308 RepID=A0ABU5RWG5_9CYAN|nr:papain-like cysteine protease family protein [Cyanobium gracile]MEA5392102.1 papain-like cysteine protease family protein [Cyanobium gracile UHCC 0139]
MSIKDEKVQPIQFFHQEKFNYCGPTCGQMYISFFGPVSVDQSTAFQKIRELNTETNPEAFYSSPEGLCGFLSTVTPNQPLIAYSSVTLDEHLKNIYHALHVDGIPCVCLVNSGAHWTVIDGIRFNQVAGEPIEVTAIHYLDPSDKNPSEGYKFMAALSQQYFMPNTYGLKWKDKLVALSKPQIPNLFQPLNVNSKILSIPGGGAGSIVDSALANLDVYGFSGATRIAGGGAPVVDPILVTGIDGAPSYTIVPLDGSLTNEFRDLVYVAIEYETNNLLEIASFTNVLQIYNDQEAELVLKEKYPGQLLDIIPGCFWKPCFELRSFFSVARRFRLEGREMYLLPGGVTADSFSISTVGGA